MLIRKVYLFLDSGIRISISKKTNPILSDQKSLKITATMYINRSPIGLLTVVITISGL